MFRKLKDKFFRITIIRMKQQFGPLKDNTSNKCRRDTHARLMCGHTEKDRIRNKVISDRAGMAPIEENLI